MPLHVLLCEPYFTGSHAAWATGYAAASRHRVNLVVHAGGFWKWRMQGAALTMAEAAERVIAEEGDPDVVVVSDMVHVPAFLGFLRRSLGDVPVVLYQHENQVTYPLAPGVDRDLTYAVANWMGMAAADLVVFNSKYHLESFFAEVPGLLRRFPDHRHGGRVAAVRDRSIVLPVGIDAPPPRAGEQTGGEANRSPVVLWNQRWEYDKDPAAFAAALERVADVPFRLILAGETYFRRPPDLDSLLTRFADRVVHAGMAEDREYRRLLAMADIVVSTAIHEFFGVAVVEAMAAGAMPLLPARLSYPELLPAELHEECLYDDGDGLVERLRRALTDSVHREAVARRTADAAARFRWDVVATRYDDVLDDVASEARSRL